MNVIVEYLLNVLSEDCLYLSFFLLRWDIPQSLKIQILENEKYRVIVIIKMEVMLCIF